jgi:hypothetical protein
MQKQGQQWFSRRSKLADFFGLKRNLVILLIAIFVIGAGEELWIRFVPKYLRALGATVFVIGLYDAFAVKVIQSQFRDRRVLFFKMNLVESRD